MALIPPLSFQVALGVPADTAPGPADWVPFPGRVRTEPGIDFSIGAGRLAGDKDGELNLVLDSLDGDLDPTNPSALHTAALNAHARLVVTVGGTDHTLFPGLTEAITPSWGLGGVDNTLDVRLVDAFSWIGAKDADVDLPAQESHERITALLDLAGWPAGLRDIGDAVVDVQPVEKQSANLLRLLFDTDEAENGDLYISPAGVITFRSRHNRLNLAPTVTFGGPGNVGIAGADPAFDLANVSNVVAVELASGDVYEAIDDTSVTTRGERRLPIRDLPLREAEAIALAQWTVFRFKEPHLWIDALTCHGHETDVLEQILDLEIGNAVQVTKTQPGDDLDETMCVERTWHTITQDAWSIELDLSPYFGEGPWFEWDNPAKGWDSGAVWAP